MLSDELDPEFCELDEFPESLLDLVLSDELDLGLSDELDPEFSELDEFSESLLDLALSDELDPEISELQDEVSSYI